MHSFVQRNVTDRIAGRPHSPARREKISVALQMRLHIVMWPTGDVCDDADDDVDDEDEDVDDEGADNSILKLKN